MKTIKTRRTKRTPGNVEVVCETSKVGTYISNQTCLGLLESTKNISQTRILRSPHPSNQPSSTISKFDGWNFVRGGLNHWHHRWLLHGAWSAGDDTRSPPPNATRCFCTSSRMVQSFTEGFREKGATVARNYHPIMKHVYWRSPYKCRL